MSGTRVLAADPLGGVYRVGLQCFGLVCLQHVIGASSVGDQARSLPLCSGLSGHGRLWCTRCFLLWPALPFCCNSCCIGFPVGNGTYQLGAHDCVTCLLVYN